MKTQLKKLDNIRKSSSFWKSLINYRKIITSKCKHCKKCIKTNQLACKKIFKITMKNSYNKKLRLINLQMK